MAPQACSTRRARHQPSNKSSSVEAPPLRLLWASQRGWGCPCRQPLAREASPPGNDRREGCEVDGESGVEIRHLEGAVCVQCANPSRRCEGRINTACCPLVQPGVETVEAVDKRECRNARHGRPPQEGDGDLNPTPAQASFLNTGPAQSYFPARERSTNLQTIRPTVSEWAA